MTEKELSTERLLLVALMKAYSEQSTYLTGLLRHGLKADLNEIVRRTDRFVSEIESKLNEDQKEYLQNTTDIYHNINLEARKNINQQYKELQNATHS